VRTPDEIRAAAERLRAELLHNHGGPAAAAVLEGLADVAERLDKLLAARGEREE
jgi:hypothetical protein